MGAVKMPCCSWRSRPIGPPAPRLGGRLPRRRLCFPPPAEERPGPAFIFFSCSTLKLIPAWITGLICFVFHLRSPVTCINAWLSHNSYAVDQNPTSAGWYSNDIQTIDVQNFRLKLRFELSGSNYLGAWSFVGANGQPGSIAIENNLDVTHETTDCARGECP